MYLLLYETIVHSPRQRKLGYFLYVTTEFTAAVALVIIVCLFFSSFGMSFSSVEVVCLAQLWNTVEKNNNLLNEPICLLDLISHSTSHQYHVCISLCFRHRGIFTILKPFTLFVTIVWFKELFQSAWPISCLRQKTFVDRQYRTPVLCRL